MVQKITFRQKADNMAAGILSGILVPLITGLIVYAFTSGGLSPAEYLSRISETDITTHAITLCVFPNVIVFLVYNRFDMLRACRGVLAVTIAWAIIVFAIKFFG